jgi:hypothetical protein
LDIASAARKAQSLNLFSVPSQILGSCPVKTLNLFRFESGYHISEPLTNHFSLMSALCVSSSDATEGQRKSTFSMENVESHHPMSKSIVCSADGTEDETISTDSMEMDSHISQSCVPSTESTDAQPISTHPVQLVEIRRFTVKSGLYAAIDSFVDALSSALLIVAVDFSRASALNRILPNHHCLQSGRYRSTLEDLTCPSHRFSELHRQTPYMFVRPQILMSKNVSDCEILCHDRAVIPMMALLHPSRFVFFLLKKQYDRIRSAVPVQLSSVFTNTRAVRPVMTPIMFVFWTGHLGIWIIWLFPI